MPVNIYLGFSALSRIFHFYRADHYSEVGGNRSTWRREPSDLPVQNLASHMGPERGSTSAVRDPMFKSQRSQPLDDGGPSARYRLKYCLKGPLIHNNQQTKLS